MFEAEINKAFKKGRKFPMHRKKKYTKGTNPCGWCQDGNHDRCRPRLDGTACSCSCVRALVVREEIMMRTIEAQERGLPIPSLESIVEEFHPGYKQQFK